MPEALMETVTFPALTLEIAKRRVVPVPDNVPRVAEPDPAVIVKSLAHKEPGSRLKVKSRAFVAGLPKGVTVHVIAGCTSVTNEEPPAMLGALIKTDTLPSLTLEIISVRVVPLPDKAPRAAEPDPAVIVKLLACNGPGSLPKLKVR